MPSGGSKLLNSGCLEIGGETGFGSSGSIGYKLHRYHGMVPGLSRSISSKGVGDMDIEGFWSPLSRCGGEGDLGSSVNVGEEAGDGGGVGSGKSHSSNLICACCFCAAGVMSSQSSSGSNSTPKCSSSRLKVGGVRSSSHSSQSSGPSYGIGEAILKNISGVSTPEGCSSVPVIGRTHLQRMQEGVMVLISPISGMPI